MSDTHLNLKLSQQEAKIVMAALGIMLLRDEKVLSSVRAGKASSDGLLDHIWDWCNTIHELRIRIKNAALESFKETPDE